MLDFSHVATPYGSADVQTFVGSPSGNNGAEWIPWIKPRGKTMLDIWVVGRGGNGGTGAIGAVSTAAGGGGGGSSGQTRICIPLALLPDVLYVSLGLNAYVSIALPLAAGGGAPVANNTLIYANGGNNGGNAAGATAGSAGAGGNIAVVGSMPLGWQFSTLALAGQAGIIGGTTVAGGALTLPVTGLLVTGGTGGGGLPASGNGTAGGLFTVAGVFPAHPGGIGATSTTTPPGNGEGGYKPISGLGYSYGGTGGGTTHATATGGGLVQSAGGNGSFGSGGGGMGGALTASAAGSIGYGGPALAIFTCW